MVALRAAGPDTLSHSSLPITLPAPFEAGGSTPPSPASFLNLRSREDGFSRVASGKRLRSLLVLDSSAATGGPEGTA